MPALRPTAFLPAGRLPPEPIRAQAAKLAAHPIVAAVFQAAGGAAAVLNAQRQVVAMNQPYLELLGVEATEALGLRAGETIGCTRAAEGADGCGTGAACASCGAALAMVISEHRDRPEERDCAITVQRGGQRLDLDLRVRASPLDLEGERHTLLTIADISAERRRQALERSFAGDVYQQVVALRSAAAALSERSPSSEALTRVRHLLQQLERAVQIQRAFAAGLGGRVEPTPRTLVINEELAQLAHVAERSEAGRGRRLEIVQAPPGEVMVADPAMLQHVLVAMVANALEATRAGGKVRVTAQLGEALVTFEVWNEGAIPAALVPRIFQRYFTTRGAGRGNGTWSMKVIGEELMRGEVGFRTSQLGGTTFWFTLPRRPFARA